MDTVFERKKDNILNLYPEIFTMIFEYLDVRSKGRAAQVCSKWRNASYCPMVWRGVVAKLHLKEKSTTNKKKSILFPSLKKRRIKHVQILSISKSLRHVIEGMPDLESLNLSGCYHETDAELGRAFSVKLPRLTELNLSLCKQINDQSLKNITEQVPNLTMLELGGCTNITNDGLIVLATDLPKLKKLNIRSCNAISDVGIGFLTGAGYKDRGGTLDLECLVLQDCQKLADASLKYISVGLSKLKSINLSFCGNITDTSLRFLSNMPSLRELNLRSCDNISDIGIGYLAEGGSAITSLDISFCERIEDQAMIHVSQGLFNLKCLSLNACSITDDGIAKLVKSVLELTTLNIGQCSNVTDHGLEMIAKKFKNLQCIDLYGCTKIKTGGLEQIMKLPKLQTLNLGLWQKR